MNQLQSILEKVPEDVLKTMVMEYFQLKETGILNDGFIRKVAREINEEVKVDYT